MKEDKVGKDNIVKKQYVILALCLSIPGIIGIIAFLHNYIAQNQLIEPKKASVLLGLFLLGYFVFIIRQLLKNKE